MSVTVRIESANVSNIQRAIEMLKLFPDIKIRVSERIKIPEKEVEYIPNAETRRAIKNVKNRKSLVYCNDIEDFWKKIDD
jgi:hypothetical protein